jgi:hypothetical protein
MNTTDIKLRLRFVGMTSEGIKEIVRQCGIDTITEYRGIVSHEVSLDFLMKSTILLLIVPQNENNEGIIPGKIFEYFASRKPILSLANTKGDVAQLINENNWGKSFAHEEENEMYAYLLDLVSAWKSNHNLDLPATDLSRFDSEHQAKILAGMIDDLPLTPPKEGS